MIDKDAPKRKRKTHPYQNKETRRLIRKWRRCTFCPQRVYGLSGSVKR